jgi:transcription-repair coupling factor (superfamily II helicase)
MLEEAVAANEGGFADEREPVRLDVDVDAYVPADYIPYEQAKIDVHRRIAAAREVAELRTLRDELEDRFGPPPDALLNLISLQQARIKLGLAGARVVSLRGGRLVATPLDLDPDTAERVLEEVPGSTYEPGRSQLTVLVGEEPAEAFPAVVRAADRLLAAVSEPAQAAA